MNMKFSLIRTAMVLAVFFVALEARADITFEYLRNPAAKKAADKMTAELFGAAPIALPAEPEGGGPLDVEHLSPEMLKFSAAHDQRLALLDRAALIGQPDAMLLKCYLGSDAGGPRWAIAEGLAWCAILANEAPDAMGEARAAAQRTLEAFRKAHPTEKEETYSLMSPTLHRRFAQPRDGAIQDIDPVVVAQPGSKAEDLIAYVVFYLGEDFRGYMNDAVIDRVIFFQYLGAVPEGGTVKLKDYARFATALSYDKTLARHPELGHQAQDGAAPAPAK